MLMDSRTRMALAAGRRDEGNLTKPTLPTFSQESIHDHSHSSSLLLELKSSSFGFLQIFIDQPFSTT